MPFIPKEWERLHDIHGDDTFSTYAQVFMSSDFDGLD